MSWKNCWRSMLMALPLMALCGCGGGGSADAPRTMSPSQSRLDPWIQTGAVMGLGWSLRSPTRSASDYLFATVLSAAVSPQSGPQAVTSALENLTTSLSLPAANTRSVQRVLISGAIRYRHAGTKTVVAYVGDAVESRFYAVDEQTVLLTQVADEVGAPTSLTGTMASNDAFNRHYDLFQAPAPTGLAPNTPWASDAAYIAVKAYFRDPLLLTLDWSTTTYDANVSAYAGTETNLEAFFASHPNWTYGGNTYSLGSGSISNIQGARVWVANTALPVANYPTTTYRALIELDQKLYVGLYYPANTQIRYRDQLDNTQQLDHSMVLNRAALLSLRQAVSF